MDTAGEVEAIARPPTSSYFRSFLRHDEDRATVIRNFYHREHGENLPLDMALRPLVAIAAPNATKWRYPDAQPDHNGSCPVDAVRIKRSKDAVEFNFHLLKCSLTEKEKVALEFLRKAFKRKHQVCDWFDCGLGLADKSLEAAAKHNNTHLRPLSRSCKFGTCTYLSRTLAELKKHLLVEHLFPVSDTMPKYRFCFEYREYRQTEADWDEHCAAHLSKLRMACGPVVHRGVVVMPSKCPFCLGNATLPPRRRYAQFAKVQDFNKHLARHLCHDVAAWPFRCPHPECKDVIDTAHDFWDHLANLHGLTTPKSDCRAFLSTKDLERPHVSSLESLASEHSSDPDSFSRSPTPESQTPHPDGQSWFGQEILSEILLPLETGHGEGATEPDLTTACPTTVESQISLPSDAGEDSSLHEPVVSLDQSPRSGHMPMLPPSSVCSITEPAEHTLRTTLAATGHVTYKSRPCEWPNHGTNGTIIPCGRTFRGNFELRRHVASHRRMESMTCPRTGCIRVFKKPASLQRHLEKDHSV